MVVIADEGKWYVLVPVPAFGPYSSELDARSAAQRQNRSGVTTAQWVRGNWMNETSSLKCFSKEKQ